MITHDFPDPGGVLSLLADAAACPDRRRENGQEPCSQAGFVTRIPNPCAISDDV
jgi:hypothetical protein